jgi:uncharacterized protein (DUF885 family)
MATIASNALLALTLNCGAIFAQAGATVEARTAALARILAEYHEEEVKREPLLATAAGDTRYNDQLPDLSASAENAWIARGQSYIVRLSEIDTGGVPDKVRVPAKRLLNTLLAEQEETHAKDWQMPLAQFTALNARLLALAAHLPFANVKDYDDYVLRLGKLPAALSQIMTNLQLGLDQGRIPTKSEADQVQQQAQTVASKQGAVNPFAAPLTRFPAAVPAADRKRISDDLLDAIATSVVPAYKRLGRFLTAMPIPGGHVDAEGGARALLGR